MNDSQLKKQLQQQAKRIKKAEEDKPTLLSQTVFTGVLGLLLVLPIIAGAYIGNWLDNLLDYYSIKWTLGFIMLGVIIGAINVYLFIKERE
ncbi:MAG: AtpZ/AtpI family protein [Gammaproteobacteria bacterium]|jgi:ATP synthase protein I